MAEVGGRRRAARVSHCSSSTRTSTSSRSRLSQSGTLTEVIVAAGSVVEPGQVVARILGDGDELRTGLLRRSRRRRAVFRSRSTVTLRQRKILASPKARRLARELGVDISSLSGTGAGGLITAEDVQGASAEAVDAHEDDRRPAVVRCPPCNRGPHAGEQARRCRTSTCWSTWTWASAFDCAATAPRRSAGSEPPTFTDLIVAACARALRERPEVNVRARGRRRAQAQRASTSASPSGSRTGSSSR